MPPETVAYGRVPERFNGAVLKTVVVKATKGSNPFPSATTTMNYILDLQVKGVIIWKTISGNKYIRVIIAKIEISAMAGTQDIVANYAGICQETMNQIAANVILETFSCQYLGIAQLVERLIWGKEAAGSSPLLRP